MKVNVIEADTSGFVAARDALGKKIGALALRVNEPVFFHDYEDSEMGGMPVVLLECSDTFLDLVKKMPECKQAYDLPSHDKTERSVKIWTYFTGSSPSSPSKKGMKP